MTKKKVDIIGAGLSGLYAACYLSKNGYEVNVYEKNESVGGAAQKPGFLAALRASSCGRTNVTGGKRHSPGEKTRLLRPQLNGYRKPIDRVPRIWYTHNRTVGDPASIRAA